MPLNPQVPLMAQPGQMIDLGKNRAEAAQLADVLQTQQMRAQMFARQQQAQQEQDAIKNAFRTNPDDIRGALPAVKKIDPYYGWKVENEVTAAENAAADLRRKRAAEMSEDQLKRVGVFAGILNSHNSPERYGEIRNSLKGLPGYEAFADQLPETYDKGWMDAKINEAIPFLEQLKQKAEADKPFNQPKNDNTWVRDPSAPGGFRKIASAEPDKVDYGVPGGYVDSYRREKGLSTDAPLSTKQVEELQKRIAESKRDPNSGQSIDTSNVKETVAGMMDGTLPPLLPGRASKEFTELMAEAHRQHYDLASAVTDWVATQKHVATMNNAQQTRLNQAINQLPDLLDSVDALASKWKGGRFPILNKANLAAAKGGLYGSDVASIANQLDAQIADVTADLANVYMGGNSPTDHALGLAATALSKDWDEKVLHDMVALAKGNVIIRRNSIKNTGVQGASENNPYAPAQPPPPSTEPPPALKNYLDTQKWVSGQGHRVFDAAGTDYGVWKKEANGTYTKVSN